MRREILQDTPCGFRSAPTALRRRTGAAVLLALLLTAAECGLTQTFGLRVPVPPTPVPVADSLHLVYELHLANVSEHPLRLAKLEVTAAGAADAYMILGAAELPQRLFRPDLRADSDTSLFAPGSTGVVYIELRLHDAALPENLEHRVTFAVTENDDTRTARGAAVPVREESPLVLSPPLRGGPWVAVYDPGWPRGHRRVIYAVDGEARIPGRHAIDWIRVDRDGRLADGDADRTRNWLGYGADVLAVADGTVAAVRDDFAESETLSGHPKHPPEDATGNYVALDVGQGRFVFYEHLQPGSIRVEAGEQVQAGQVIGALGFTGQSTGPHLHFHVADANSPLGAEGMPFVLDRFELLGAYENFDDLGSAPWTPAGSAVNTMRSRERPGPNAVVTFPGSDAEPAARGPTAEPQPSVSAAAAALAPTGACAPSTSNSPAL